MHIQLMCRLPLFTHAPPLAHTLTQTSSPTPSCAYTLNTLLPPHPFINTFLSKAKKKALQLLGTPAADGLSTAFIRSSFG